MATKENSLTADEIVRIIGACGDARASVLQFRGLYVRFSRKEGLPAPTGGVVSAAHIPVAEITAQLVLEEKKAFDSDALALKEDEMAEMWLTNPVEAEKLLANGDLDEEDTDGEDETA